MYSYLVICRSESVYLTSSLKVKAKCLFDVAFVFKISVQQMEGWVLLQTRYILYNRADAAPPQVGSCRGRNTTSRRPWATRCSRAWTTRNRECHGTVVAPIVMLCSPQHLCYVSKPTIVMRDQQIVMLRVRGDITSAGHTGGRSPPRSGRRANLISGA